VNHRGLNVRFKLTPELQALESTATKLIKDALKRGAVDVLVTREGAAPREIEVVIDRAGLRQLLGALAEVAAEVGAAPPTLDTALRYGDFLEVQRKAATLEELEQGFSRGLDAALAGLREMREREAAELLADVNQRLGKLDRYLDEVEAVAPKVYAAYAERLKARLDEAAERQGLELDPGRVATELVVWSDKSDVTEEVVRARAHLVHVREQLAAGDDETGKRLDFLAQELFREFNTIGSKCRDAGMAAQVVDAKVELEKIREQVQNIA
jgi:uncharacterized protein (TIGR00255 family)